MMERAILYSPSTRSDASEDADDDHHVTDGESVGAGSGSIGGGGSDGVVDDDVAPPVVPAPPGLPRRRRRPTLTQGVVLLMILSPGMWAHLCPREALIGPIDYRKRFFGCVAASWSLKAKMDSSSEEDMADHANRHCRYVPSFGTLIYRVLDVLALDRPDGLVVDAYNPTPNYLADLAANEPAHRDGCAPGRFHDMLTSSMNDYGAQRVIARLAPSWVRLIFGRRHQVFHAVSITSRVDRSRIFGPQPRLTDIQEFRNQVGIAVGTVALPRPVARRRKAVHGRIPIEDIVSWLYATRGLSNTGEIEVASHDWARIFSRDPLERARLRREKVHMNREVLRNARVRLDCTMMLLTRAMFEAMSLDMLGAYIFCDGSPQWRGWELFASTMDIMYEGTQRRMLMPVVCLARTMLSLLGTRWECMNHATGHLIKLTFFWKCYILHVQIHTYCLTYSKQNIRFSRH